MSALQKEKGWIGPWARPALISLVLFLVTLAVYWPVTGFDFINFDDHDYVTENFHVLNGLTWRGVWWACTTGHTGNWHPLTWLSHMADVQWFGTRAGRHHLTNLIFHAANAALLFLGLQKLTGAVWRCAFVAALFALHPLHVESVAWIAERKDVLSAFFGLLCLLFYACHARAGKVREAGPNFFYALALFSFALALLSKPMLVTWPLVLLLLDYWPLQRISVWKSLLVEKIPFFAFSVASCVVTFIAQRAGGAVQSLAGLSLSARLENALVSYARYLGKTFWPADLALPYPYPGAWPMEEVLLAAALMGGMSAAAVWLARSRPYFFVGWFCFLVMLAPVIGLVQVGSQAMADRYTYLPLTGIFIIVVWSAGEWMARGFLWKIILGGAGLLLLAACAGLTARQAGYWRNSGALFSHAIAVTKNNDVAYSNLGNYFLEQGRVDEAMGAYQKALQYMRGTGGPAEFQIDPKKGLSAAEILNNLGTAWARKGKTNEATEYYRAALRLNPDHALAWHNLGFELAAQKNFAPAIEAYAAAVRLSPDQPDMRDDFGGVLFQAGRVDEAIAQYNAALRAAPNHAKTHNFLGLALVAQGRTAEAIAHYETALRLDPNLIEVHNNLGSALVSEGKLDDAIRHFRLLLQWMPDHPRAHDNLGVALASKGELNEAIAELREAIRLQPGNAQTHYNLGNVLAMKGNFNEAAASFARALQLSPDLVPAHCNLGGVLAQLGRRQEAIAQFKEALRLNPDYAPAREQLRGLGETVP